MRAVWLGTALIVCRADKALPPRVQVQYGIADTLDLTSATVSATGGEALHPASCILHPPACTASAAEAWVAGSTADSAPTCMCHQKASWHVSFDACRPYLNAASPAAAPASVPAPAPETSVTAPAPEPATTAAGGGGATAASGTDGEAPEPEEAGEAPEPEDESGGDESEGGSPAAMSAVTSAVRRCLHKCTPQLPSSPLLHDPLPVCI